MFSKQREKAINVFEEYCEISGLHGVRFLSRSWPLLERILWFIILIISLVLASLMLKQMFANWDENPVQITVDTTGVYSNTRGQFH